MTRVAPIDVTVLVSGENASGKKVVAEALIAHPARRRARKARRRIAARSNRRSAVDLELMMMVELYEQSASGETQDLALMANRLAER